MIWLFGVSLLLLLFGWLAFKRATALHKESGLPQGRLVYMDTHGKDWQESPQPLYSATHRLVGKPDYLVETPKGVIPVEVKSSAAPEVPYLGHILQLAAYCLLVEETTGRKSPHGLLKYADALYEVDFTEELKAELLFTMEEMRQARTDIVNVARNHNQPGKCAACGFNGMCEESLV